MSDKEEKMISDLKALILMMERIDYLLRRALDPIVIGSMITAINHALNYHDIAKPEMVSDNVMFWSNGPDNLELIVGTDEKVTFVLFENGKNTKQVLNLDDTIFNIRQSFVYNMRSGR